MEVCRLLFWVELFKENFMKREKGERFICSDGAELILLKDSDFEQYEEMEKSLCADGFGYYDKRKEGDVVFSTFIKDNQVVYLSYTPSEKCIRQISKKSAVLYKKENLPIQNRVTPLITQVRNAYFSVDCGMAYVIRVCDGRFILIDGGIGEYEEADHLWDVLTSQYEGDDKPIIVAWFITHPHCDHFGGFVRFMDKYGDKVSLESILYNWALESMSQPVSEPNDLTEFNRIIETYRNTAKIITPRTGQRYVFADAIFDVLFVCEDLYPEKIPNVNNTSLVMRMELAGRRVLWMGDMQKQGADYLCRRFPAETFKCEIFQVGHHGYGDGSDELHRKADPEVLLWPCPNFWFPVVRLWETNDYWLRSPNVRTTIVSGQAETVLDMTKPIEEFKPYTLPEDSEIIYEEHFDAGRVMDLHWSCITGGTTGYQAANAILGQGECNLQTTDEDMYTVCEFVQSGQMEQVKDFTLTFSGKVEKGTEKFGIFWNYSEPTIFSEEHALWLEPEEDGSFTFHLMADWNKGKARLYLYEKYICELPYKTSGGLYFILKNASVTFEHIQMTRVILCNVV